MKFKSHLAHQPLEAELRANISNGRLQAGDKIWPEVKLAACYGIGRSSVRIALDNLVREGLLSKVRGSGTFVASVSKSVQPSSSVPNIVFLSLATALSKETFFSPGTYQPMLNGMTEACMNQQCNLMVAHIDTDWAVPPCLARHEVQGILFHGQTPPDFYRQWIKPYPHVAIQYPAPEPGGLCVKGDNLDFSLQAVNLLLEHGCRRIGFVTNEIDMPVSLERYYGYRMALHAMGLPYSRHYSAIWQRSSTDGILSNERMVPDYRPMLQDMFARPPFPDALICVDDWRAYCTMEALSRMGLNVPEDVCIIGGHNDSGNNRISSVTGFDFRLRDICRQAVASLLMQIQGSTCLSGTLLVPPVFCPGKTLKEG